MSRQQQATPRVLEHNAKALEHNVRDLEGILSDLFGRSRRFRALSPEDEPDRRPVLEPRPPPPLMYMRMR